MSYSEANALDSRDEWDALADRVGAEPFSQSGWIVPWHAAFGAGDLRLGTVRRDGDLVAALPFLRSPSRIQAPVNSHTPQFSPIAVDRAALDELLAGVFGGRESTIELSYLDEACVEIAGSVAGIAGRRVLTRELVRAPYVDLSAGWEPYAASFSSNRRKEWRRVRRRLEEQGAVAVDIRARFEDLDAALAEIFVVEGSGWKAERGTAIASRPETRAFYTAVCRWAHEKGWLRLCALRLDGRAIAVDIAMVQGRSWYAIKGGYDVRWAKFAPGNTLLRHSLEEACGDEVERFELLGAPDSYKLTWANGTVSRNWVAGYTDSPRGRGAYFLAAARERVRPFVRRQPSAGAADSARATSTSDA